MGEGMNWTGQSNYESERQEQRRAAVRGRPRGSISDELRPIGKRVKDLIAFYAPYAKGERKIKLGGRQKKVG
jgi:hypothetical protein